MDWLTTYIINFIFTLLFLFIVRSNAKNNWLNPTLAHLPEEAAKNMFECLCQCVECEMIKFLILKGQRLNGQIGKTHALKRYDQLTKKLAVF